MNIHIGYIVLYEYKTDNFINEIDIAYTLLEDFGNYQLFKIILSDKYQEDYFSFKINIKNDFIKDIFIFLPSKLRNSYSEPITIQNNNQVLRDSIEEIIPTEEIEDISPIINSPKVFKGSEIATVWNMAEKIKNSEVIVVEKAGHILPAEKPLEVNKALNAFLKDSLS